MKNLLRFFLLLFAASAVHAADHSQFIVDLTIDENGSVHSTTVTVEAGVTGTVTTTDHGVKTSTLGLIVKPTSAATALLTLVFTDPATGTTSESAMEVRLGETASMTNHDGSKSTRSITAVVRKVP